MSLGSLYQSGDWKGEKHVPVIHAPETAKKGEIIDVKVIVGEEIPHPNVFEHYIAWVKVYFKLENGKFPIEIGTYAFAAHGESEILTEPYVTLKFKVPGTGTLMASSYCNIHGLWENSQELTVTE
ncbi:MAG: class II SORL domain-containing protein [Gudongella sp.]|nr:class II SORL domain-containing protein [Gudongella sp.]